MGLDFRKPVRAGAFRFDFSESAVCVSGMPGFVAGSAPRGHYITVDARGVRYRRSAEGAPRWFTPRLRAAAATGAAEIEADAGVVVSDGVLGLEDVGCGELLRELNRKRWSVPRWPLAAALAATAVIVAVRTGCPPWATLALLAGGAVASGCLYLRDAVRRSAVVYYELPEPVERAYGVLARLGRQATRCDQVQHVDARQLLRDSGQAYNAGRNTLLRTSKAGLGFEAPAGLRSNLVPLRLKGGKLALYFYPDRALMVSAEGFRAIPYADLNVDIRFIDFPTPNPPQDATLVDHTWLHVKNRGLPNRRFKDNRKIPVCRIVRVRFRSEPGLDEVFDFSRETVARQLGGFLEGMAAIGRAR